MARRRALGRALTGFAENFLPAWQSMQYMDRLKASELRAEEREERLRRRDAQSDVAAMQTGMRREFAPESDVAQNALEIMANNPGVYESVDDVIAMLTGSLATTPERFGAMGANLTPDQIKSMTPAVVRARASRAGFDMDQWDKPIPGALTPEGQIPSEGFVGYTAMPPGQEGLADLQSRQERSTDPTQILPGPLTDPDVLASIQKTAPTAEQLFGGITPTQDLGETLAAQFGDYQTQQGEWGAAIAGQANQRELERLADQQRQAGNIAEEIAQGNFGAEMSRRLIEKKVMNAVDLNFFLAQEEARNQIERENLRWGVTDPVYTQAVFDMQENLAVMRSKVNGVGQIIDRLDDEGNPLTFGVQWNADTQMREYVDLSDVIPGRPFSEAGLQYETDPLTRRIRDLMTGGADISNQGDRSKMVESLVEEGLATPEAARERVERLGGKFNESGQSGKGPPIPPDVAEGNVSQFFGGGATAPEETTPFVGPQAPPAIPFETYEGTVGADLNAPIGQRGTPFWQSVSPREIQEFQRKLNPLTGETALDWLTSQTQLDPRISPAIIQAMLSHPEGYRLLAQAWNATLPEGP